MIVTSQQQHKAYMCFLTHLKPNT